MILTPDHPLFDNPIDAQYFDLFCRSTSRKLSTHSGDDIWRRVILQACHEEEFARHAVVAIAALHKTSVTAKSISAGRSEIQQKHHTYALLLYAKALRLMRASIGQLNEQTADEHQLRKALIASLLTTCFEFYHGNQTTALGQIVAAVKLLFAVRERVSPLAATSDKGISSRIGNSIIDRDLLSMFARLELTTVILTRQEVSPQIGTIKGREDDMLMAEMPAKFQSLGEARFYRDVMLRRSLNWHAKYECMPYLGTPVSDEYSETTRILDSVHTVETETTNAGVMPNLSKLIRTPVPPELYPQILMQISVYADASGRFTAAFLPLYIRARQHPKHSREYQGATTMMIAMQAASLRGRNAGDEESMDEESRNVLDLVQDLLESEEETRALESSSPSESEDPSYFSNQDVEEGKRPSMFVFDAAMVLHLFIVATRSRDRMMRREATDILKRCNRRENLWDSEFAAKVAEWFIELDEQDEKMEIQRNGERTTEVLSRRARLVMTDEVFDLGAKSAWVRCRRVRGSKLGLLPFMSLRW